MQHVEERMTRHDQTKWSYSRRSCTQKMHDGDFLGILNGLNIWQTCFILIMEILKIVKISTISARSYLLIFLRFPIAPSFVLVVVTHPGT